MDEGVGEKRGGRLEACSEYVRINFDLSFIFISHLLFAVPIKGEELYDLAPVLNLAATGRVEREFLGGEVDS